MGSSDDRYPNEAEDRLAAEIETLHRWYDELKEFLDTGLQDATVSDEVFSDAATMATRVVIRLKGLYSQAEGGS
jgi:hypothetical protein